MFFIVVEIEMRSFSTLTRSHLAFADSVFISELAAVRLILLIHEGIVSVRLDTYASGSNVGISFTVALGETGITAFSM